MTASRERLGGESIPDEYRRRPIATMVETLSKQDRALLAPAVATLEELLLEAGFHCVVCANLAELSEQFERGAGVILLTAQDVANDDVAMLHDAIARQPAWSDVPVILLTSLDDDRAGKSEAVERLGNVMLQPWPAEPAVLVSVIQAALRARRSQYAQWDHLEALRQSDEQWQAAEMARQRAEAELRASEDRFQSLADDIPSIVRTTQEQLRETDRRKDQFLAMLAHELRNPLMPIRSGLEVLALTGSQHPEIVEVMQQQTIHLARLVDDLLDVSRIVRGRVELRKEAVELRSIIDRSVATVSSSIASKEQRLSVILPAETVWLNADPIRLIQVVENLLSNASKYTDSGGHIQLSARLQKVEVQITVRDNGIGIEPDLLPGLFDLFSQAACSIDRSQGGLGIGLTLVKNLVEMHGGTVIAASGGRGQGSEFTVRLPVAEHGAEMPRPDASPVAPTPARRILVVDDNVGAVQALSLLLSKMGEHRVEMASNGVEALERIRQLRPELVLLDIGLPGMNGYEVAKAVRDDPELDGILLAAVTGYGQLEDRQRSAEAGFDRHLVKPFGMKELAELLAHPKLRMPRASESPPAGDWRSVASAARKPDDTRNSSPNAQRDILRRVIHDLRHHSFVLKMMVEMYRPNQVEMQRGAAPDLITKFDAEVQALGRTIETLKSLTSAPLRRI
jgi:signal transduction histidine kinase/ActR/RegA family two-component response regulator